MQIIPMKHWSDSLSWGSAVDSELALITLKVPCHQQKYLDCALQHLSVVDQYLAEERSCHRMAGPFNTNLIPGAHISRFGVIPNPSA